MKNTSGYYICKITDKFENAKVVFGPYTFGSRAADVLMEQDSMEEYFTGSRYRLAKWGLYPKTKVGDAALLNDLETARLDRLFESLDATDPPAAPQADATPDSAGRAMRAVVRFTVAYYVVRDKMQNLDGSEKDTRTYEEMDQAEKDMDKAVDAHRALVAGGEGAGSLRERVLDELRKDPDGVITRDEARGLEKRLREEEGGRPGSPAVPAPKGDE